MNKFFVVIGKSLFITAVCALLYVGASGAYQWYITPATTFGLRVVCNNCDDNRTRSYLIGKKVLSTNIVCSNCGVQCRVTEIKRGYFPRMDPWDGPETAETKP